MRRGWALPRPAQKPPLPKGGHGDGETDCHTSDIGHWIAMTGFFHELRCKSGRRVEGTPPYNHTLCRAGPVYPAGGGGGKPIRVVREADPYETLSVNGV